ncbi:MAG: N-acetylglucosamine-6-phosphate deacetylase [Oscillospiraceae bacterium]|jgi:N-acetylglucosamine-6-phosphate deacetylase|nr:N-acetylglucosamine-6-phosphate deacetylase [Oscillospiraceae bacterium]
MILKNAKIFDSRFHLIQKDISVEEGKIKEIGDDLQDGQICSLTGCMIAPGFVDIHIHGCVGADTGDKKRSSLVAMAKHLQGLGVTSFCPTTMTTSTQDISEEIENVRDCMDHPTEGAAICGVNMEGPYISPERCGAQKDIFIRKPDWKEFEKLYRETGKIIKLVDIAPEREGGKEFIQKVSPYCCVSLAHTNADYEMASWAFQHGISHVTHLFNAMQGMQHRAPGAVGAVFDAPNVKAEIICDGFHIHPAVLRIAFRILGEDRTIIISDSMRAAGMPDGESELGGQKVFVKNSRAYLKDGTIAGSTTNMLEEIQNLIQFGVPVRQVIKSATINPAKEIGLDKTIGSIEEGKRADFAVLSNHLDLVAVMQAGRMIFNKA